VSGGQGYVSPFTSDACMYWYGCMCVCIYFSKFYFLPDYLEFYFDENTVIMTFEMFGMNNVNLSPRNNRSSLSPWSLPKRIWSSAYSGFTKEEANSRKCQLQQMAHEGQ